MEKNDIFVCEILNYGSNGEGVAKTEDGKIAFVPYSLKGEKVVAKVLNCKKDFLECKLLEVNQSSVNREKPLCKYYGICGGCQLQHANYLESLKVKQEIVQTATKKIGKIDINVLPTIASSLNYAYRNKVSLPFDCESKKLAMHDDNNNLIEIDDCVITQSWCNKLIKIINEFVKKFNISCYNSKTNKGLLKQLIARKINKTLLITLIINGYKLEKFDELFAMLLLEFESVGLSININTKAANYLPTNRFIHLCGEKEVVLEEFGVRYSINNACFMQVNTEIKQKIYESVIEECKGFDLAIDCYSGAGLLTALISKNVKRAIGVEIVKEATKEADKLCLENNILNVQNICEDSCKAIQKLSEEIKLNKTVLVLDPPRKGCDKKLLLTLNDACPNKIVYISCNPATLSRDLNILCGGASSKYKVNFIRPYDMFPQTKHVETLAVLSLK